MKLFLSCEHGGNVVPPSYQSIFSDAEKVLNSHRGWDIGALELFNVLRQCEAHFSDYSVVTRLLVDLNRSLHRKTLFSEFTRHLNNREMGLILTEFYHPFRNRFFNSVSEVTAKGEDVFHISVHSFTPELNGEVRNADIGLLYNPSHANEKEIAGQWKLMLKKYLPHFKIRFNYPYLGKTDGHVAPLRIAFGNRYNGIEFELNNKHAGETEVMNGIRKSLVELLGVF
ncbi:N-formylglutamate amidohydrolase [Alkalitalea saponilacus]|uniref:N-formylglutamate amidohydrolase n=1 Tax=Alkalitalea saponilacus TaxID=889453 RepID=A0A1T5HB43_9BACT|nr:N-formylglutamate amidohydrolase [Alkalitalea saponilacus]ASB50780.1 N-formylglutamate amidohydrolase [Alkalitalea saponilacus]SKC17917.1 N-formylglutamate amidohydrolase [Alkalitalea saponilacus]